MALFTVLLIADLPINKFIRTISAIRKQQLYYIWYDYSNWWEKKCHCRRVQNEKERYVYRNVISNISDVPNLIRILFTILMSKNRWNVSRNESNFYIIKSELKNFSRPTKKYLYRYCVITLKNRSRFCPTLQLHYL